MQITVVLSTYNGENYIAAQLDSILNQTQLPTTILVRDDGSTDATLTVLTEHAEKHNRIILLKHPTHNIGIQNSYLLLLQQAATHQPDYVMFADQDDIWLPNKIEKVYKKISSIEANNRPVLVFSDATVVNETLNVIHPSFLGFQHYDLHTASALSLKALLLYCPALGCTMIFNHALLQALINIPATTLIPDKCALMIAAALGQVGYIPDSTILYRQHGMNMMGALRGVRRRFWNIMNFSFIQQRYQAAIDEAHELIKLLPNLPPQQAEVLKQFVTLFTGNYVSRLINYTRFCLTPPHWKRKMGLFFSLFFQYKKC